MISIYAESIFNQYEMTISAIATNNFPPHMLFFGSGPQSLIHKSKMIYFSEFKYAWPKSKKPKEER